MRIPLALLLPIAATATVALAGRPLVVNDDEPVEHKKFQLESGISYLHNSSLDHFDLPVVLTYGLTTRSEIAIGSGAHWQRREAILGLDDEVGGVTDTVFSTKWKLLDEDKAFADQGFTAAVKFPTADEDKGLGTGEFDYAVNYVATKHITKRLTLDWNLGYAFVGSPPGESLSDLLFYGIAAEYELSKFWQPVVEIYAFTPVDHGGDTAAAVNAGIRYRLRENLILDAAIGTRLCGNLPDLTATIGFTWVF